MWLSNSSIGRKFVMALTGACLVLFVTFHCLMNAICIIWPMAYNLICEFLGANWYALIASMGLGLLFIIHIIYACWLTLKNRKARGPHRYSIEKTPATVEWSSKNMLVLGIVILAFLVVHLIQFWAKMQLVEVLGKEGAIPATAGTLFIQQAFSCWATPVIYIIGFIALWFHMNHGMWSMFQSVGWTNNLWIPRLKKIGCWWTSIVVLCFVAQAIVFTYQSSKKYYSEDPALRNQYVEMAFLKAGLPADKAEYSEDMAKGIIQQDAMNAMMGEEVIEMIDTQMQPGYKEQAEAIHNVAGLMEYLSGYQVTEEDKAAMKQQVDMIKAQMQMQMQPHN